MGGRWGTPIIVGAVSMVFALAMMLIMIAPRNLPGVPSNSPRTHVQDGVVQTHYWAGLLKEEWQFRDGRPEGTTIQYYPNASVMRVLNYENGVLNGSVKEYYEQSVAADRPSRKFGPSRPRASQEPNLKGEWTYENGRPNGPYFLYHRDGSLKEEGEFMAGKRRVVKKYPREGKLTLEDLVT